MDINTGEVSANMKNQLSLEEATQRGIAASESGDKEGAYAIFRQVTEEHPGAVEAWVWLGWSSADKDESEAAFRRALEIDPDSQEAAMGMQWVASERGTGSPMETPTNAQYISGALSTGPVMISGPLPPIEEIGGETRSLDDLMQLGIATAQAGDKATANITFQSVVDRYPDVPEAWVWLAGTTTNLTEAENAFQTAANLDPSNEEARLGLRWVALRRSVMGASTAGTGSVTNPTLQPYDTGVLSSRNLPDEAAAPSAMAQFLKQPAFIFGILIVLSILIIVWLVIRR
ncbi:MAG: tetratricopeptide repeat protein [Chloroflexia bacterium]